MAGMAAAPALSLVLPPAALHEGTERAQGSSCSSPGTVAACSAWPLCRTWGLAVTSGAPGKLQRAASVVVEVQTSELPACLCHGSPDLSVSYLAGRKAVTPILGEMG